MSKKHLICTACGSTGKTKKATPGSILIEIILWLCFLVPGLIYSIWRHTKRHAICATCGSAHLVPLDTPAGRQLAQRFQAST